ncbi:MAG: serine/threonine protein kinase [Deltaproteobacteria bacterium]|nr:serine/threonine protein kinase [Deltaproteobacteria bacterium]
MPRSVRDCPHCLLLHAREVTVCPFARKPLPALTPADDAMEDTVVDGKYRVQSVIGVGAVGVVVRAKHLEVGRSVALKMLRPGAMGLPESAHRFLREIRAVGRLAHPNVVDVLDAGALPDGTPWLAMELLEGESLKTRLDRKPQLPIPVALRIADELLSALEAVHAAGVIHRDIKPENVFLASVGDRDSVKLLDFGLAKVHEERDAVVTRSGQILGTPLYLAPEQIAGQHGVDHRVDLWATAVMLFEMLAGRPPFDAVAVAALLVQIMRDPPPHVRELRPEVPVELDAVIDRALDKLPGNRFSSAKSFRRALAAAGSALHP